MSGELLATLSFCRPSLTYLEKNGRRRPTAKRLCGGTVREIFLHAECRASYPCAIHRCHTVQTFVKGNRS